MCLNDVDDNNGRREMTHFENVNINKDVWQKRAYIDPNKFDALRIWHSGGD